MTTTFLISTPRLFFLLANLRYFTATTSPTFPTSPAQSPDTFKATSPANSPQPPPALSPAQAPGPTCQYIAETSFDQCGNNEGILQRRASRAWNRVTNMTVGSDSSATCNDTLMCRHITTTGRIRRLSFGSLISEKVSEMMLRCCGRCAKYHEIFLQPPLSQHSIEVLNSFHLIYPVYAPSYTTQLYGFHFVPVVEIPGAYYFTLREPDIAKIEGMVDAVLVMWPLTIVCLLSCFFAGFAVWLLDTWVNEQQFPRSFVAGVREGFWWGFISMTTVGYGDKYPKSQPARILAIVWILLGVTGIAIFVGTLTTEMMMARNLSPPDLRERRVGVLKDRLHETLMVTQHQGIITQFSYNDTVEGVVDLTKRLENNEIDGFLISIPTYYYYAYQIKHNKTYSAPAETIKGTRLDRWEKHYRGTGLVAGTLVKDLNDYKLFNSYIQSNWLQIQICYSYDLAYKHQKFHRVRSRPLEGVFFNFFTVSLGVLVGVLCFGGLFEVIRKKKRTQQPQVQRNSTRNEHGEREGMM